MNHHGDRTRVFAQKAISLRAIVPLGFLVLTCCMAQVEAGTRPQPEDAKSSQLTRANEQLAQSSANQPTIASSMTNTPSDAVQEGRMLLGKQSTEPAAKRSKDKGKSPTKRLDASAEEEEEEEEEEDEEADEEAATGNGSPKGGAGMGLRGKSIQADFDNNVRATLKEVVVRGAVLSVVVSLHFEEGVKNKQGKDKRESQWLSTSLDGAHTHLLDYETGTTFPIKKFDGYFNGRMTSDQREKTLRATFEVPPKNVKTVGITISGVGTFDDVKFGSSGGSGQRTGSSKTEDIEEEDEEDEEDVEEEDSKGLTKKKGAKKAAKKGAKKGAK